MKTLKQRQDRCKTLRTMARLDLLECVVGCVGELRTFQKQKKHGKAAAKWLGAI